MRGNLEVDLYLSSNAGAPRVWHGSAITLASTAVGGKWASFNIPGNNTPFRDIDHSVAEGPALDGCISGTCGTLSDPDLLPIVSSGDPILRRVAKPGDHPAVDGH